MAKKGLIQHIFDYYRNDDITVESVKAEVMKQIEQNDIQKEGSPAMAFNASPGIFQNAMLPGANDRKFGSGVSFQTLRQFSEVYDVARMCINHRKRQISNLDWNIVPKDDEADPEKFRKRIDELETFFSEPYHNTPFRMFVDRLMEDLLVIDGAVLWKDKTYGGQVLGLLNVDAATIRIRVASDGTLPEPPEFAYQQVINGSVHEEYTTDEMYYKMINPRTNTPYGLSPLESLVLGVDSALRSQTYNQSVLKEGNVPEGFFTLPKEWKSEQIKEFQEWFDTLVAGNPMRTTRLKFMPDGKYFPTKKPADMQFIEFEKWLLKKTCAMFDVQPRDIGFEDNAQPGNAETQQQMGIERGLVPTARFLKELFNEIIRKDFKVTDLKFEWQGLQATDVDFELQMDTAMLEHGALTIDEWRSKQGYEPFNIEATSRPVVISGGQIKLLDTVTVENDEAEREATRLFVDAGSSPSKKEEEEDKTKFEIAELRKWRKKSITAFGKGQGVPAFSTNYVNNAIAALIRARLAIAKSKDDVRVAFDPFIEKLEEDSIAFDALKLSKRVTEHKRSKYAQIGSDTE